MSARDDVAAALAEAFWLGFKDSPFIESTKRDAESVGLTLRPVVARLLDAARAEALREAADAWSHGQWSDVMLPKPTPPAVPVIAYANRVGDWLRDRAEQETDE